jgi:GNAT superfamily N-acetyltransferase
VDVSLDECVELDRLNMAAVLAAAGEPFCPAARRARLEASVRSNGELLGVWAAWRLVGYLEYRRGAVCSLRSLQVHPDYRGGTALAGLLRQFAARLAGMGDVPVESAAHRANAASLRLHRWLGFTRAGRNGDKVNFRTRVGRLLARLRRLGLGERRAGRPANYA